MSTILHTLLAAGHEVLPVAEARRATGPTVWAYEEARVGRHVVLTLVRSAGGADEDHRDAMVARLRRAGFRACRRWDSARRGTQDPWSAIHVLAWEPRKAAVVTLPVGSAPEIRRAA